MSGPIGLLASQLLLCAVGYALLRGVGIGTFELGDLRLIGLAYFSGWAAMGLLATLALMLGAGETMTIVLLLAAAAIAVGLWLGRSATRLAEPRVVESRHPLAVAAGTYAWIVIAIAAASAAIVSVKSGWNAVRDFDAINFWVPKAEVIFTSRGLDAELWRIYPHPEYPPLAPASDAFTFLFAGQHPSLLPTQRAILGLSFLLSLVVLLGRFVPRWVLLPFVAALATATWFWTELGWLMVDLPVTCLVGAAAVTGFLWLVERHRAWLVLAWIFVAAASLAKFEGLYFSALLVVVIVSTALVRWRRQGLAAGWLLLAPAGILLWRLWLSRHGLPTANSNDYHLSDALDPHYLSDRTFRLTRALSAIPHAVASLGGDALGGHSAALGWVLILPWLGVLFLAGRRMRALAIATAVWFVAALAGLALIYWIGRPKIDWYIGVSLTRVAPTVVVAGAALTMLLLGLALGEDGHRPAEAATVSRRSRLNAVLVALVALGVVLLADVRPMVQRTGKPSGTAIGRQLITQFRQELMMQGYYYELSASCDETTPDALSYVCLLSTSKPEGSPPKILQWNVQVSCGPQRSNGPRCLTDHGEALG